MEITLGNLIDQLCVTNQKIWNLENVKRNPDSTDKELAEATKKVNVLNQQRNDYIQAIDEVTNQKHYNQGSTKNYGK